MKEELEKLLTELGFHITYRTDDIIHMYIGTNEYNICLMFSRDDVIDILIYNHYNQGIRFHETIKNSDAKEASNEISVYCTKILDQIYSIVDKVKLIDNILTENIMIPTEVGKRLILHSLNKSWNKII